MPETTPPALPRRGSTLYVTPTHSPGGSTSHSRASSDDFSVSLRRNSLSAVETNFDDLFRIVKMFVRTTEAVLFNLQHPDDTTEAYKTSFDQATTILPHIINNCDLAFKNCLLAVDAQLRCLEILEGLHSENENAPKFFAAFKKSPPVQYAQTFLKMPLRELHDREEKDIRDAIIDCFTDETGINNDFITRLKMHSAKRSAAAIIRDGASVSYVEKSKNTLLSAVPSLELQRSQSGSVLPMPDLESEAVKSLMKCFEQSSIPCTEAEATSIISSSLETILANTDYTRKKAIATWLVATSNYKFSNRDEMLSGVQRNNDLEKALNDFLIESKVNDTDLNRWVGSIIKSRRAVQLITSQTNQISSKTKMLSNSVGQSLNLKANNQLANAVIPDFYALLQGLRGFIRYSSREMRLRKLVIPKLPQNEEKGAEATTVISTEGITTRDEQISHIHHYASEIDKQFNYFIKDLSQAAVAVNNLNIQPIAVPPVQTKKVNLTVTPSQEVIQSALQAVLFRHVQAENFSDDDFVIMEAVISDGMREPDAVELKKFEEFNLQISFFQSQITVLDSFLQFFEKEKKRKAEAKQDDNTKAEISISIEDVDSKKQQGGNKEQKEEKSDKQLEAEIYQDVMNLLGNFRLRLLNLQGDNIEFSDNKFLDALLISFKNALKHKDHFLDPLKKDWIEPVQLKSAISRLLGIFQDLFTKESFRDLEEALRKHFQEADKALGDVMDNMWHAREDLDNKSAHSKQELLDNIPDLKRRRSSIVLSDKPYVSTQSSLSDISKLALEREESSRSVSPNDEISVSEGRRPSRSGRNRDSVSIFSSHGLEELSRQKVSVNAADIYGNTPLHYAVKLKNARAIKLLLDYKADPSIKNKDGKTAFDLDENKLLQNWRDSSGNSLLHRAVIWGQVDQIICALRCKHSLTVRDGKGNTPLDVCDDKKAGLFAQFVRRIPSSEFRSEFAELYHYIMAGQREVAQSRDIGSADILAIAKLASDEHQKFEKMKASFEEATRRYNEVIKYLYQQLFKAKQKNSIKLLSQLRAVQEAIVKIANGDNPQAVTSNLAQSFKESSALQTKIQKIDWRFQCATESDLLIPAREVTSAVAKEDVSKDTELHLAIRRNDLERAEVLATNKSNASMFGALNASKCTPIMLATQKYIECNRNVEQYKQAINAIYQAFTEVEIYLFGKLTKYSPDSSDHTKLMDKIKEVALAKNKINNGSGDAVKVLQDLKSNKAIIEKRNKWHFWNKHSKTVQHIDKTLGILVSPAERLDQLIRKLDEDRSKLSPVSKAYKNIGSAKAALLDAKAFIVNKKQNPLITLANLKQNKRLTTGFGIFARSASPVLKEIDKIIKDISPPNSINALAPPSEHVATRQTV